MQYIYTNQLFLPLQIIFFSTVFLTIAMTLLTRTVSYLMHICTPIINSHFKITIQLVHYISLKTNYPLMAHWQYTTKNSDSSWINT